MIQWSRPSHVAYSFNRTLPSIPHNPCALLESLPCADRRPAITSSHSAVTRIPWSPTFQHRSKSATQHTRAIDLSQSLVLYTREGRRTLLAL